MKIAVASMSSDDSGQISNQAGRAPYYLIFDEQGNVVETISNPFSMGGGGAGFGVAKMLADRGVAAVISANFGPNMESALHSRGVKTYIISGTVRDAVLKIIDEFK